MQDVNTAKLLLFQQFHRTKTELMGQRSAWQNLMVAAEREGNSQVATTARMNRDRIHEMLMDFCSRADISKIQLSA